MVRFLAAFALALATQVQAVALHASSPPISKKRKHELQVAAYIRKHSGTTPKPVLVHSGDTVEIKLDGQAYPCQVTAKDAEADLYTVSFSWGKATPAEVSSIPKSVLRKITQAEWNSASKQLAKEPGSLDTAVGLARKLVKWNSLPAGRKLAARKMADKKTAKVLGPKAKQPEPKKAIQKLETIAAKQKHLREKAAVLRAERTRKEQARFDKIRAKKKEALAARKKALMKTNPAQYKAELLAAKARAHADARVQEEAKLKEMVSP